MSLNRKIPPGLNAFITPQLPTPSVFCLDNGIPICPIQGGSQDIVKIDFIFKAGKWYQPSPYIAYGVNRLMKEGTCRHTSAEIAEKLDFYGAFLDTFSEADDAVITLYSLNKHLDTLLPLLEEIIKMPEFPQKEIDIFIQKEHQRFIINQQKVKYLARTHFMETIFGAEHPYGKTIKEEVFSNLHREAWKNYHSEYYRSDNCKIILSGKIPGSLPVALNRFFGGKDWENTAAETHQPAESIPITDHYRKITKHDTQQSGIRIGRPLFNRTHPDYFPFTVLNTLLGDYFGSRLMTNLREEKGYTYGIGSQLVSFRHSGYLTIASEVNGDSTNQALQEIMFEIQQLREIPIKEKELSLVKNYMLGSFLHGIEDPFSLADKYKKTLMYGKDFSYYYQWLDAIQSTSAEKIAQLANAYLKEEDLWTVVAGK
jgi:predicted Zn-dependent peptidase